MALAEQAPCFVHYGSRVYALDPVLGNGLMPINVAPGRAIERLGLICSLAEAVPRPAMLFPAA